MKGLEYGYRLLEGTGGDTSCSKCYCSLREERKVLIKNLNSDATTDPDTGRRRPNFELTSCTNDNSRNSGSLGVRKFSRQRLTSVKGVASVSLEIASKKANPRFFRS